MKSDPVQGDIDKLKKNVPNNIVAHGYFFERLTNSEWLDLLRDNGLFSHPPSSDMDKETETIAYAAWPQSRYLARMAPYAPEKVLAIMLVVPPTDNIRVYEDFAIAAAAMPGELAAQWAEREVVRVGTLEGLFGLLPEKLSALMNHLLKEGQVDVALRLARSLLDILPDPKHQKQNENEEEYSLPPEPRGRFSAWEYRRILERMIPLLSPAARFPFFDLFCDLLEKAITLSKSASKEDDAQDYSFIWQPHLEDKPWGDRPKHILVSIVRKMAHAIAEQEPTQVRALVEKLNKRRYEVFQRIALDLLRRHPDPALIAKTLTDRRLFDARGLRHEFELLAQEQFGNLEVKDQQKILAWIDVGPDDDEAYRCHHKECFGQEPSDQEIVQHKKRWQRGHLAPLQEALSSDWKQRYEELIGEVGQPEQGVTKNSSVEVWRGPTSPMTAADFESMTIQEIVTFLSSWEPTRKPMSPSRQGLGRELTEAVHKAPIRFASEVAKFQGLDPTYVRSVLEGIRQGTSETNDLPWSQILSLCLWVISQPVIIDGRQVDKWSEDPDWGWTRRTIVNLLDAGFDEGSSMIPFDLRTQVWSILDVLTRDPDPTPDDEAREGEPIDPPHIASNSTRGAAMQVVVHYALWVRHCLEPLPDGATRIARGFEEMPEVRQVLDAHLDLAQDRSLGIRSVYGRWLPSLTFLDAEWTRNHVQAIFPKEDTLRRYRDAAWDTYLVYCHPYSIVFEVLHEEYRKAIELLGTPGTTRLAAESDTDTGLVQHLMTFYWNGKLPFDDATGLLVKFFEKAKDALRGEALEVLGRSLSRPDELLSEENSVRLKKLWEKRLATITDSGNAINHTAELAAFGWWFVSQKFDDAWAVSQLLAALSLVQKTQPDYQVVERLVAIAETMPLEAVQCLAMMVQGDKEGWEVGSWRDYSRKILASAIASDNPSATQAVAALVNRLAARGMPDYKDLLPGSP